MNNQEFVERLSRKIGIGADEAANLSSAFVASMVEELEEGNSISIQGFGNF